MARGRKPAKRAAKTVAWDGIEAPAYLCLDAQAEYRRLAGVLKAAGTLEKTDPKVLESWAVNVDLLTRAYADIDRDGLTVATPGGGLASHPSVKVLNSASMRIKAIAAELGLTPASSKYGGGGAQDGANPWEGLLSVTV